MSFINEIKNQLSSDNKEQGQCSLPWEINQEKSKTKPKLMDVGKNKLAKIGVLIIVAIIIAVSAFNLINNSKTEDDVQITSKSDEKTKQEIQVHVAGEVNKPGLYKLEIGSRIWDAIQAAGGFSDTADKNSLNLAKVLEDGEQILINSNAQIPSSAAPNNTGDTTPNGKVNINTADLAALQTLSGVGPSTAQKIIDYRTSNGKFKSIEDIKKVSGIGDKTFEKFKDKICV